MNVVAKEKTHSWYDDIKSVQTSLQSDVKVECMLTAVKQPEPEAQQVTGAVRDLWLCVRTLPNLHKILYFFQT